MSIAQLKEKSTISKTQQKISNKKNLPPQKDIIEKLVRERLLLQSEQHLKEEKKLQEKKKSSDDLETKANEEDLEPKKSDEKDARGYEKKPYSSEKPRYVALQEQPGTYKPSESVDKTVHSPNTFHQAAGYAARKAEEHAYATGRAEVTSQPRESAPKEPQRLTIEHIVDKGAEHHTHLPRTVQPEHHSVEHHIHYHGHEHGHGHHEHKHEHHHALKGLKADYCCPCYVKADKAK
jgi:hypothetical protein